MGSTGKEQEMDNRINPVPSNWLTEIGIVNPAQHSKEQIKEIAARLVEDIVILKEHMDHMLEDATALDQDMLHLDGGQKAQVRSYFRAISAAAIHVRSLTDDLRRHYEAGDIIGEGHDAD